ncbi:sulfurtransferase complex subunit TusB [Thalassotalea sp. PLHSN55]|uniref:sulfurtransferase complex subunit TusB n=1 Tax=Thalassotalea sp. PLHSN55 TaxID=3435888 RepID=UPI003F85D937
MTTLHILRTSPFQDNELTQCLSVAISQDNLVLIDDACYGLNHPTLKLAQQKGINVSVITKHATARGLTIAAETNQISMTDLVTLTFNNERVITWQ